MNNPNDRMLLKLSELLVSAWNNTLSEDEFAQLEDILRSSQQARDYYYEFQSTYIGLTSTEGLLSLKPVDNEYDDCGSEFNPVLWQVLAEAERTAPVVKIEDSTPADVSLNATPVKIVKVKHEVSKFLIFATALSCAAMCFLMFLILFTPERAEIVAYMDDSLNAVWGDCDYEIGTDGEIRASRYVLKSGYAKVIMGSGAMVVFESPSEIVFENDNQLLLTNGILSAKVPESAVGFTVRTPNASVVDFGTEFSVIVNSTSSADVYVHSGEVDLRSGPDPIRFSNSSRLKQDQAARASFLTGQISTLPFEDEKFVRNIESGAAFAWTGRNIDLADIIGGGNGFGTGSSSTGIDLNSGEVVAVQFESQGISEKSKYFTVGQLPFVDGVFVPDGGAGNVQIASNGLTYSNFPDTSGQFFVPICNNLVIDMVTADLLQPKYLSLKDETISSSTTARMCLHPDAGITFDLAAIRRAVPGLRIIGFKSRFGISDEAKGASANPDADIFILVDGKESFTHLKYNRNDDLLDIAIELNDTDRFLTIVCTEGTANSGDWPLFVEPVLELSMPQN